MVIIKRYIFLIVLLLLMSCGKNEFTLRFDVDASVTDNYDVTYYATDVKGGITVQAVASVREGKCLLTGITKRPTLAFLNSRMADYPLVIYAQRGDKVDIGGEGNNPLQWVVKGNKINEKLSEWRSENIGKLQSHDPDSVNFAIKKFVEENPEEPSSTILLLCYYDRGLDEQGYVELMTSLKGDAKKDEWLKIVARADQMVYHHSYPAKLESLVMRSVKEGADTLKINNADPVFLIFWQSSDNDRKNTVDSLKWLEKSYPDSTLLIADVCLDADSLGWRNAMRKDSLELIKRLWAPTVFTDPAVTKFKVKALPYYIVFDKEGNQVYRGKNLPDAMKTYRELHNAEPRKLKK